MPDSLCQKKINGWIITFCVLFAALTWHTTAFGQQYSKSKYFKLKKGTGLFHYDREKQENWLKGAMWKQYKKIPLSVSNYARESYTYLKDVETVELIKKESFTQKRGTANNYYEEGGVGYVQLPDDIPEHNLTMYRVKVLTGEAVGKEGWVYEDYLGSKTGKPGYQPKSSSGETASAASKPRSASSRKGSLFLVKLKSGKTIVSKVYKELNDTVTLMKGAKTLTLPKEEIASVKTLK
ncbi:MAG: hypothetical protein G3M70_10165 [Candidatus Nitronauta litoralis]|uniref:Uncharacterized protein n=1 Tax=Candidatus Nitronauta litoralis TaxID=2705533 RepID=A0A7T0BWJ5_9BACT|nr:MAG: hypothetical protein G3M70_10165 [Candidatus Nitronauta litoralis]